MTIAVSDALQAWSRSPRSRVAITGATGWIGTALAHFCADLGLDQTEGRLRLFGAQGRTFASGGRSFAIEPLGAAPPLGDGDWLVFHFAFLGKERTEDLAEQAFAEINDKVLDQALRLAESAAGARFVFASSGAVYGPDRRLVDASGNAYGYMKVCHEIEIRRWAQQRGIALSIPRIFNVGGPHINKQTRYALSDFISQARNGGRISIGATRPVFRSFVHVDELCRVLLEQMVDPALDISCFDTAGREIVEIGDLAQTVLRTLGIDGGVERPVMGAADGDWYVGEGRFYQEMLARTGTAPKTLETIIAETAAFMAG